MKRIPLVVVAALAAACSLVTPAAEPENNGTIQIAYICRCNGEQIDCEDVCEPEVVTVTECRCNGAVVDCELACEPQVIVDTVCRCNGETVACDAACEPVTVTEYVCVAGELVSDPADCPPALIPDAGMPDAFADAGSDASVPDASLPTSADAGIPDAGNEIADAGQTADAGISDAGELPDAGADGGAERTQRFTRVDNGTCCADPGTPDVSVARWYFPDDGPNRITGATIRIAGWKRFNQVPMTNTELLNRVGSCFLYAELHNRILGQETLPAVNGSGLPILAFNGFAQSLADPQAGASAEIIALICDYLSVEVTDGDPDYLHFFIERSEDVRGENDRGPIRMEMYETAGVENPLVMVNAPLLNIPVFNLASGSPAGAGVPGFNEVLRFTVYMPGTSINVWTMHVDIDPIPSALAPVDEFNKGPLADRTKWSLREYGDSVNIAESAQMVFSYMPGGTLRASFIFTDGNGNITNGATANADTVKTFSLRVDTTGASPELDETIRLILYGVEWQDGYGDVAGAYNSQGVPVIGGTIIY